MQFSRAQRLSTILVLLAGALFACARTPETSTDTASPTYVGGAVCASCHAAEAASWAGSHHDLAMQEATDATVLGDFNQATVTHFGVTSTFYRDGDAFMVRTDGPDGTLQDFRATHVFGVDPLQQLLISFPDGRKQALSLAWDARPASDGGQRWYHLYPDEPIPAGDELHWTRLSQNWNYQCASCHSTNLQKGYDLASNRFNTTWSEMDVSCEACHGPGSRHVAWAKRPQEGEDRGLTLDLSEDPRTVWQFLNEETGIAERLPARTSRTEIEVCAACHSRRSEIAADYPTPNLLDSRAPALLAEGLYHPDGQPANEVYVYGSFRQSKMYTAGVTCQDCHDPHSLKLRAEGNPLCSRCHQPERFDTPEHHHHEPGSVGAQCINCHMPAQNFMGVDSRREHAFRIPRPDLTLDYDSPNACNDCHTDRDAAWADAHTREWYGAPDSHFASALDAARTGSAGAGRMITLLAEDRSQPALVRASAVVALQPYLGPSSVGAVQAALADPDPLVRRAGVTVMEGVQPNARFVFLEQALRDSVLAVRAEAGRVLASTPRDELSPAQRQALNAAIADYRRTQLMHLESPQTHLNLGILALESGDLLSAEGAYRQATILDSTFTAAAINLADLFRLQDRDADGEALLRDVIRRYPRDAGAHHALGLLLVRQGRSEDGLQELREAAEFAPGVSRYGYTYGIALHSAGEPQAALNVLELARQQHPGDRQILFALTTIARDQGWSQAALRYARELFSLNPDDPAAGELLKQASETSPE